MLLLLRHGVLYFQTTCLQKRHAVTIEVSLQAGFDVCLYILSFLIFVPEFAVIGKLGFQKTWIILLQISWHTIMQARIRQKKKNLLFRALIVLKKIN